MPAAPPPPGAPCLLFFPGAGLSAWVIRWWTRSRFAHVAPCESGNVHDAFWNSGVTARPFGQAGDAAAVAVPVTPVAPAGWLDAQTGKQYDRAAIVLCGLCKRLPGWLHAYDSKQVQWTCSRLTCVWAGLESRAWGLSYPPTPEDVFEFLTESKKTITDDGPVARSL